MIRSRWKKGTCKVSPQPLLLPERTASATRVGWDRENIPVPRLWSYILKTAKHKLIALKDDRINNAARLSTVMTRLNQRFGQPAEYLEMQI